MKQQLVQLCSPILVALIARTTTQSLISELKLSPEWKRQRNEKCEPPHLKRPSFLLRVPTPGSVQTKAQITQSSSQHHIFVQSGHSLSKVLQPGRL